MALVTLERGAMHLVPAGAPTPMDNSMPGLGSFIVFVFLAISLYFLLKNMNARLRRMSYRERERLEEQEAAARESDGVAAEPATEPVTGPAPGPAPDPTARPAPEPLTGPTTEPTMEPPADPTEPPR